jgi:nucleotide-binding universal stress UspA family protein
MTAYARILVGIDGSGSASRAASQAIELAACCGAELHLVCVVPVPAVNVAVGAAGANAIAERVADDDGRAAEALRAVQQRAGEHEVATVTHLVHGEPATAIVATASEVGAGAIVVGNRGVDAAGHYLLGNVPEKVLLSAPCDVLIVRTVSR